MAVDGSITIGIGANTDKFDKQLTDLEKKMRDEEKKKIEYEADINLKEEQIQKAEELFDKIPADIDKVNAEMQELAKQMDSLKIDSPEFEIASQKLQELQIKAIIYKELWNRLPNEITKQENKVEALKNKHEEINQKIAEYKQKIESVNMQRHVADVNKLKSGFNTVGSSIQNSIGKVARLALGIFGISSAINALSRASSNLATYDKQYAANLEYIRYVLTQMIAPVLYWIVNLAAKLLGYINAIMQGWFGINLFSRGSAKNFAKMKAGAGGVAKAVKEIKKQLAGFDEINMLTDQSSSGAGGGGAGGVTMPSFDLSKIQGDPPKWLKWIIDNKDLILAILAGITAALIAWHLGLGAIKALGIGLIVAGVVYAIQSLIKYLKDPSFKNFGKIIQGIGIAVIGVGVAFLGLPAIIAGVAIVILGTVIKYWEQIRDFLQRGIDWLTSKSDWVRQKFGNVVGNIYDTIVNLFQSALNYSNAYFTYLKNIFDGIIKFIKGVFTGNWKMAFEGLKQIVSNIFNMIYSTIQFIFNVITNFISLKIKNIISFFSDMAYIIIGLFNKIATKVPETISTKFKAIINATIRAIESILNKPIKSINLLISAVNELPRSFYE